MTNVIELSNGNPGAFAFLMEIMSGNTANAVAGLTIIPKIEKCGIKGTDLYVLWSDLCDKNVQKVAVLCKTCPDDVLKDACGRQDYSGRKLVAKYLEAELNEEDYFDGDESDKFAQ